MGLAKPFGLCRQRRGPDNSIARHCVGGWDDSEMS